MGRGRRREKVDAEEAERRDRGVERPQGHSASKLFRPSGPEGGGATWGRSPELLRGSVLTERLPRRWSSSVTVGVRKTPRQNAARKTCGAAAREALRRRLVDSAQVAPSTQRIACMCVV